MSPAFLEDKISGQEQFAKVEVNMWLFSVLFRKERKEIKREYFYICMNYGLYKKHEIIRK
jgi:hypothetical protein